jgi:hypothetical protein
MICPVLSTNEVAEDAAADLLALATWLVRMEIWIEDLPVEDSPQCL